MLRIRRPVITENRPLEQRELLRFLWAPVPSLLQGQGNGKPNSKSSDCPASETRQSRLGVQGAGITTCPSCLRDAPYEILCKACLGGLWHQVEERGLLGFGKCLS